MPSQKKVAWAQLRVGIMAMIGLLLISLLIFLLTGADNPFKQKNVIYTYLNDSGAMTEGSAVRLNGILAGKVKTIRLTGDKDLQRTIRMELEIDSDKMAQIPVDSEIGFSAENVLGQKFLNIKRGTSAAHIQPGGELRARDDRDFLEVVQSALPILDSMQTILKRVDRIVGIVERGEGSIGKLLTDDELYKRLNDTIGDVNKMTNQVSSGQGTIGRLLYQDEVYNDFRKTMAKLDVLADDLQAGKGTAGKFLKDPALYDELQKTSAEIRGLVADLNAGKGTAGKLLKDDAMHQRILATLDNLNRTIDNINSGKGTIGQLMVNPQLYESLNGTTLEVQSLLKDFRANPKKFLTIQLKLF
jgi:phospholipid/cholesterol/gamma-HCH transport system substrate-binding protein